MHTSVCASRIHPESASPLPRIWLVSIAAGQYTWNADNRLVSIENATHREEYDYDYMGRRWRLKTYTKSGGAWVLDGEKRFVYDGYRQIAEFRNWAKFIWANCVLSGHFPRNCSLRRGATRLAIAGKLPPKSLQFAFQVNFAQFLTMNGTTPVLTATYLWQFVWYVNCQPPTEADLQSPPH